MSKFLMLMCVATLALLALKTVSAVSLETSDLSCRRICWASSYQINCRGPYFKAFKQHYPGCTQECKAGLPFDFSRSFKAKCPKKKRKIAAYEFEDIENEDVSQYEVGIELEDDAYELEDFDSEDLEVFEVDMERSETRSATPYSPYY